MEEKQPIKVNLSTILLIIALIVIAVMAYFIYKFYNDKELSTDKVEELNGQVITLENTVDKLQGTINNISDTLNTSQSSNNLSTNTANNTNSTNVTTTSKESSSLSNAELKKTIQNYLNLVGSKIGSPSGALKTLGINYKEVGSAQTEEYIKTNIKYSAFKEEILKYMTDDWYINHFNHYEDNKYNYYKEEDGYLCYWNVGATGMLFEVKDVTLKGDYSNLNYIANIDNIADDGSREQENIEFHIVNNNGIYLISYCDY